MPIAAGDTYKIDVFDATKAWDLPLIEVGILTLDRVVQNFFAESEQSAFSPSNLVAGIELSNDRILQGRTFIYPETQRHRLGSNFNYLPINCPFRTMVKNYERDGSNSVMGNFGDGINYEPNSYGGPKEVPNASISSF